jgi:hypothetical protein
VKTKWTKPQLSRLVDEAPAAEGWLYEGSALRRDQSLIVGCGPIRLWSLTLRHRSSNRPFCLIGFQKDVSQVRTYLQAI